MDGMLVIIIVAIGFVGGLLGHAVGVGSVQKECEAFGQTRIHNTSYTCTPKK